MELQRTFVMLKPDAVQRGFIGEIIARLERCGLKLIAMKFMMVSEELAKELENHQEVSQRAVSLSLFLFL